LYSILGQEWAQWVELAKKYITGFDIRVPQFVQNNSTEESHVDPSTHGSFKHLKGDEVGQLGSRDDAKPGSPGGTLLIIIETVFS